MRRFFVVLLMLACAVPLRAQTPAGRLVEAARAQLGELNPDSAVVLLESALAPGRGATVAEQTRGFVLYGIAQLLRDNIAAAQLAFRQALQRDATLQVDSLDFFTGALQREFAAARLAAAPSRDAGANLFAVEVSVPADTTVPAAGGAVRIETQPSSPSRVVTSIASVVAPTVIVWSDTQDVAGVGSAAWNLRGRDDAIVAAGRYALRVRAVDPTGQVSPDRERILVITRVEVETTLTPAPLLPSSFAAETLYLRRGSPSGLASGLAIAAAAAFVPTVLGNAGLKGGANSTAAYAVSGAVSIASIAGFLRGSRARAVPENIMANAQLRQRDEAERQRVAAMNARLREGAAVRVRVEGAGL